MLPTISSKFSVCFIICVCFISSKLTAQNASSEYSFNDNPSKLKGKWILTDLRSFSMTFGEMFPSRKPEINFDMKKMEVSGYSGCNTFGGIFSAGDGIMEFSQLMSTEMLCPESAEGEKLFMSALSDADGFRVKGKVLRIMRDGRTLMKLKKV